MSGWTYPYSSGALPIKAAILIALGHEPEGLTPLRKWTCAERAFISIPGTVKQIVKNKENADCVNDFFMRTAQGGKVSFPENNVTKCGNVIASAPDRETAIRAAETTARSVLIRLDPADKETGEFLAEANFKSKDIFPPDAFELTNELKNALSQIPETETPENTDIADSLRLGGNPFNVFPFPAFTASNICDYMGRTPKEALEAAGYLTGLTLPITPKNAENKITLGRSFWTALIRGSYQGAVYYIDNLGINEKKHLT
jgi:hypothetical protein